MIAESSAERDVPTESGDLMLQVLLPDGRFGLPVEQIVEVVPLAALQDLPSGPEELAGLLDYHGVLVPVVDLGTLVSGTPSTRRLSTRIIIARLASAQGESSLVGVLAEGVRETTRVTLPATLDGSAASTLGSDEDGALQVIELQTLIPHDVRALSSIITEERAG